MAGFSTELSGSVLFQSGNLVQAALVPGVNSLALTGSFNITGSELTFNGQDIIQRFESIEAGYVDSASLYDLNQHSSSINDFTASLNLFTGSYNNDSASSSTTISNIQDNVSSLDTRVGNLESDNGNYYSSSQQILADGFLTSSNSDIISSSQQLTDLGFVTSSFSDIPAGTISSSVQITNLGFITSSESSSFATTASYIAGQNVDGTVDLSISASYALTASYIDPLFISASAVAAGFGEGGSDIPAGTISSSKQISDLGFITSSTEEDSIALSALNVFTSAYSIDSASFDSKISNITIDTSSLLTTASYELDSASFDSRISGINVGGDTSYNGAKTVTNPLLGELYSQSFNPGTTGSIQDFLTAVFFPASAPVATFTDDTNVWNANTATIGTSLTSVSITDTVDDSPYTLTLTGTGASSLTAVPQNAASSSWQIQPALDLTSGIYYYTASVGDKGGATADYTRTINISNPGTGTLSVNGNLYIIESATTGPIYLNSNGRTGTQGQVSVAYSPNYGSQVATNFQSSNSLIAVNSTTGVLSVGDPISGSVYTSGTEIDTDISWEDQYGNHATSSITISVRPNYAPAIIEINNSSVLNTNLAVSGTTIVTVSFSDTEGDAINYDSYTFDNPSGELEAVRNGTTYLIKALTDLPASSYSFTSTVTDEHGFTTRTSNHSVSITQATAGTISGDTVMYIIESATSGDVFRDATGYNNGNPADIDITYIPNYGSQTPTFISSNPAISVDSNGGLTLGVDLSGSLTQSGATFNTTLTWEDQYGNSDSSIITATVFGNQSPGATLTVNELNNEQAISGSVAATLSIIDTESNTPFSVVLSGISGSLFNAVPQNAASSSWQIQPTGALAAGSYPINVTVTDSYSEQSTLSDTIVISAAATDVLYVYDVGFYDSTYNLNLGIQSVDSNVPPIATGYTGNGFVDAVTSTGNLGTNFTYNWGSSRTAVLLASSSGANANTILTDFGAISKTNSNRFVILVPSGSDMTGVPKTTTDQYGGSDTDEYVLEVAADGAEIGSGLGTTEVSNIHKIQLDTPVNGVSDYIMVGPANAIATSTSIELRLIPESGSAS